MEKAIQLLIERMAPEGKGLGRWDGRIVFVPFSAPGDRLEVAPERVKERYALGRIARVLEPGPGRIEPACPLHFRPPPQGGRAPCGGCDWQHLAYAEQLKAKRDLIEDCLSRIAKLKNIPISDALPSPLEWRYRNKVQVPFGKTREDARRIVAGFYSPGTHRIVDFADCPVQPELSVRLVLKVKDLVSALNLSVYDEEKHSGWLRHVFLRINQEGRAVMALVTRSEEFPKRDLFIEKLRAQAPELSGLFQNVQPLKTSVVLGPQWRKLWGADFLEERIGRLRLRSSPGAFLQVNTRACEVLYGLVAELLAQDGFRASMALDLYCGVGAIALWISPLAEKVVGVEENRKAVEDAWDNARLNGVKNVRFLFGRVETSLGKLRREIEGLPPKSAAAVLDPPRAGLSEAALKFLRAPALERVVYVSCNPATFARDAAWIVGYGYALRRVVPVDLFPQTSHVELAALFERGATN